MKHFKTIKGLISPLLLLLQACSVSQQDAHERDRPPENRQHYKGMDGLRQYNADTYDLLHKESQSQGEQAIFEAIESKQKSKFASSCKGASKELLKQILDISLGAEI
jgi:DNA-binding transcriptional regulator GbsR (MarR family)